MITVARHVVSYESFPLAAHWEGENQMCYRRCIPQCIRIEMRSLECDTVRVGCNQCTFCPRFEWAVDRERTTQVSHYGKRYHAVLELKYGTGTVLRRDPKDKLRSIRGVAGCPTQGRCPSRKTKSGEQKKQPRTLPQLAIQSTENRQPWTLDPRGGCKPKILLLIV